MGSHCNDSRSFVFWSQRENQGTYVKAFCFSCYLWPVNYSIQSSYKRLGVRMEVKQFQQNSKRNPPSQVHDGKKRSYWLQLRMCVSQVLSLAVPQSSVVWSIWIQDKQWCLPHVFLKNILVFSWSSIAATSLNVFGHLFHPCTLWVTYLDLPWAGPGLRFLAFHVITMPVCSRN